MEISSVKKNGPFILTVLILGLLLLQPHVTSADVSLDTAGAVASNSSSVTVASNTNMVLLAWASFGNFSSSAQCTWNGGDMTIEASSVGGSDDVMVNSKIAPATGPHTLTCGSGAEDSLTWVSIYDADQTASEDAGVEFVGSGDTSPSVSVAASATSMTFGGFKLDRNASSPVPMTGLTGLTPIDATAGSAYGIGVTTFGFTSVESNGGKLFATIAWAEATAGGATFVPKVMMF